jgi:hypothetical protein
VSRSPLPNSKRCCVPPLSLSHHMLPLLTHRAAGRQYRWYRKPNLRMSRATRQLCPPLQYHMTLFNRWYRKPNPNLRMSQATRQLRPPLQYHMTLFICLTCRRQRPIPLRAPEISLYSSVASVAHLPRRICLPYSLGVQIHLLYVYIIRSLQRPLITFLDRSRAPWVLPTEHTDFTYFAQCIKFPIDWKGQPLARFCTPPYLRVCQKCL